MGKPAVLLHYIIAGAVLLQAGLALKADIRADSNRDGSVDVDGSSDLLYKMDWTDVAGAIFLANIGDTDRRCSKNTQDISDEAIAACNDASDDIPRQMQYMATLKTVKLGNETTSDTWGTVRVHDETARKNVRLFRKEKNKNTWVITKNDDRFSADELRDGLELKIDARDTRRPGCWDGRAEIVFYVQNSKTSSEDAVRLRVAPVLTHHTLQPVKELLTTAGNKSTPQETFVRDFEMAINDSGIDKPLYQFNSLADPWTQDFLEPAYTSMPGPNSTLITLQVMIRSSQGSRAGGRMVFTDLRKTGRGAVYSTGGTRDGIESTGNLETIPPYRNGNKFYPAGRVVQGFHNAFGKKYQPQIYDYLRAQELQDPLIIDVDWLAVGHVDEIVQFLPANTTRGWAILIADPEQGIKILQNLSGDTLAFSRETSVQNITISKLLENGIIIEQNMEYAKKLKALKQILQDEIGVTEIFGVPSVFHTGISLPSYAGIAPERNHSSNYAGALYPAVINGLALSSSTYLAPKPWGPIINDTDVFEQATRDVYGKIGYEKVLFIDDWDSHHQYGGEVHCGTNSIREPAKWWDQSIGNRLAPEREQTLKLKPTYSHRFIG